MFTPVSFLAELRFKQLRKLHTTDIRQYCYRKMTPNDFVRVNHILLHIRKEIQYQAMNLSTT